ncbi:MAG: carbohydrate kinase family protein [Chloroflexi bacterium]|nr:carbohydrate kinase family protein [Chloroflexota bacterium]MBI5956694.1 carbohydrate kinase family protein [Chloroflexota bacterium]
MTGTSFPEVVVVGAASIDIKGKARFGLVPATSNPGEIKISAGGVARNVAENLARLGVPTALLTAVGDDAFGRQIVEHTAAHGVDMSHVLFSRDFRSAAYLAVLNEAGSMAVSIDDMQVAQAITPRYISQHRDLIKHARMMVLDANLPVPTLTVILKVARKANVPVCIDPVSIALSARVKRRLREYSIITPNASEAEILCGMRVQSVPEATLAAQKLVACGLKIVIITLAEEGLFYATPNGSGHIPAIKCEVVDATGAGDALTAGVVYGLVNGLPVDEAMRLGVSAATITLLSTETVSPEMSLEALYQRMVI